MDDLIPVFRSCEQHIITSAAILSFIGACASSTDAMLNCPHEYYDTTMPLIASE